MPTDSRERRIVTVLFSDLSGFTRMSERLDPEEVQEIVDALFRKFRPVIESHGGTIDKFIGNAVTAIFGAPVAYEDDPARAVRSALAMQHELGAYNASRGLDLRMRIGLNTGEVLWGGLGGGAVGARGVEVGGKIRVGGFAGMRAGSGPAPAQDGPGGGRPSAVNPGPLCGSAGRGRAGLAAPECGSAERRIALRLSEPGGVGVVQLSRGCIAERRGKLEEGAVNERTEQSFALAWLARLRDVPEEQSRADETARAARALWENPGRMAPEIAKMLDGLEGDPGADRLS